MSEQQVVCCVEASKATSSGVAWLYAEHALLVICSDCGMQVTPFSSWVRLE